MWNGKLHYYSGLYLLAFVWLFAVTGLLINHPVWSPSRFWESRKQEHSERRFAPGSKEPRELAAQLGLTGEISDVAEGSGRLDFRVGRPGTIYSVSADPAGGTARVDKIALNGWGVLLTLHRFNGGNATTGRNWILTRIWTFSMDATAVGLALMVLSSLWMWIRLRKYRVSGCLALAAGVALSVYLLRF